MKRFLLALGLFAISQPLAASPWEFGRVLPVANSGGGRVFHHLDSAGRKSIAASGGTIAVVWEDNRDQQPGIYIGFNSIGGKEFNQDRRISGKSAAYEPVIAAIDENRFLVGWEEDSHPWLRVVSPNSMGQAVRLSPNSGGQINLVTRSNDETFAVWVEQTERVSRSQFVKLRVNSDSSIDLGPAHPVDAVPPSADQLYPSVTATQNGAVFVAWEDRRPGHTVILTSYIAKTRGFSKPNRLNEFIPNPSSIYGRGYGVARVALTTYGDNGIAAIWSDKRNFRAGYDVFSAFSSNGGKSFTSNILVQDEFGDLTEQWHPAIAGSPEGLVAAVWDDNRDDTPDIWLSWSSSEAWSDDLAVPGASGPAQETHPTITFDSEGNLHLAWVVRDQPGGPTRLRYVMGHKHSAD